MSTFSFDGNREFRLSTPIVVADKDASSEIFIEVPADMRGEFVGIQYEIKSAAGGSGEEDLPPLVFTVELYAVPFDRDRESPNNLFGLNVASDEGASGYAKFDDGGVIGFLLWYGGNGEEAEGGSSPATLEIFNLRVMRQ